VPSIKLINPINDEDLANFRNWSTVYSDRTALAVLARLDAAETRRRAADFAIAVARRRGAIEPLADYAQKYFITTG
jgi:hypothetical protein